MAHLLISAAHKSSGKTTVSIGLAAALSRRGHAIQTFKKGPDFIDPMWLSRATGQPCFNLDYYTMNESEILTTFARHDEAAEISLIEGNKGLYDGLDLEGGNSNAALASLLGAPVVLVIDARGMTRGIAPLLLGYQAFEPDLNITGVILNKVGGTRHEGKLRAIIEHYTDLKMLGAIHRDPRLEIPERHLGLMPSNEAPEADAKIDDICDLIATQVDLNALIEIAKTANPPEMSPPPLAVPALADVKIGIARDSAFGFYYPDDLVALETAGAELVAVDLTVDTKLPEIDGLFVGGGFPETRMDILEGNSTMRMAIKEAIEDGLPTYAECGGLMYLARSLTWRGETRQMADIIPGDIIMHDAPQGRGYVRLQETGDGLWPSGGCANGDDIPAHEFHYSSLENLDGIPTYAYKVLRGHGIDGRHDGLVMHNLLACYAHFRDVQANHWARRFVEFVRQHKNTTHTVESR